MNQNIIIGCGGAGLKTLAELNRMLTQNPDRVSQLHDEVFYLAVDTCETELGHFADEIAKQMGPHTPPHVELVCLSHGVEVLADAFHEPFVARYSKCPQDAGLARLKEHWWFDANGVPFMANGIQHLSSGACIPQVAYGLAWYHLGDIESAIKRIMDKMLSRGKQPHVTLRIVAGLAGGTGRGAWALTAFKVREVLRNHYRQNVHSEGFFFDASVYDNVGRACKNMDITMKVNALTGLSELSGGLENTQRIRREQFRYRLPSLATPERTEADLLKGEPDFPYGMLVRSAFLVCGRSRAAIMDSNVQYHRMAGAALYAMVARPEIMLARINDSAVYKSFAAATFEVEAVRIQAYCEILAGEKALDSLMEPGGGSEAARAFLSEWPVAGLLSRTGETVPKADGTLVQRVAFELLASPEYHTSFKEIRSCLLGGMEEEAIQKMKQLAKPAPKRVVREALGRALHGVGLSAGQGGSRRLGGKALAETLEEWAENTFRGGEGQLSSLTRLLEALGVLRCELESVLIPPTRDTDPVSNEKPLVEAEKTLRDNSKRTFWRLVLGGKKIPATELNELIHLKETVHWGLIPRGILLENGPAIQAAIAEEFQPVLDRIDALMSRGEALVERCREARMSFVLAEGVAVGGNADDDGFSLLFSTPDRIEETLLSGMDSGQSFHRTLRPIAESRGEVEREVSGAMCMGVGLADHVWASLSQEKQTTGCADDGGMARKQSLAQLLEAVRKNTTLPAGFMASHFSFCKVLERNLPYWHQALAKAWNNGQEFYELANRFETMLGTEMVRDVPGLPPSLPGTGIEALLPRIAASLAAACRPWWIADSDGASGMLFVPFTLDGDRREKLYMMLANSPGCARFSLQGLERGRGSPFCMVAFASEDVRLSDAERERGIHPLDKVQSLDYYKEPQVKKWLQMAESPSGESVFSTEDGNRGKGYLSPVFVRNENLSSCRWKPWMDEVSRAGRVEHQEERFQPDVFISYRRETGRDTARTLQQALKARGYSVFFDYDSLRDGIFNQAIYKAIENCRVFVAFLSKGSLDRCSATDDWVRTELEHALQKGKKIVPIAATETLSGWHWPSGLPQSLAPLKAIQISELHTGGLFEESLDKLLRERFPKARGDQEGREEC